ncbi:hypothetical protein [Nocardiopsis sp. FIRDI 009]|uniref:hypothetical protein n=1 Tax=Nocardiopsis sp. FIRDI 009 TaxID=714197 RepID=UPI000E2851B8|nr:hypothetical protein [Nocardiopsis sp. FIRDI 009]
MYETVSSPSVPERRSVTAPPTPRPRAGLLSGRRPGERPPSDVRQTCALMFVAGPFFGFLAYAAWDRLDAGAPGQAVTDLWTLLVLSVLAGAVAVGLAVPVLRAVPLLWRAAQFGALAGMGVALSGLHRAAQLSSTLVMVAAALAALLAIVVNIALWTTAVRRWCDVRRAA